MKSDAGSNYISEQLNNFCRWIDILHVVLSSYNHQSDGQADACIKSCQKNSEICYETKDIYMALLQLKLTMVNLRLPSMANVQFSRPARGLLPTFDRLPVLYDDNEITILPL